MAAAKRLLAIAICVLIPPVLVTCAPPWIPDFAAWPLDTEGYDIEELRWPLSASYARGTDVYLGLQTGEILRVDDRDLSVPAVSLGRPLETGPRLLFVSRAGVVFVSADGRPMHRSGDDGQTWQVCLDVPVWRMDEDDDGSLYAGNYTKDARHVATLYKSTDGGRSWTEVFRHEANHHIHTVRWDERAKRLYIAYGDGPTRGQAYSDDRGATFQILAQGPDQGHTDVAFTDDYVLWASDDQSGRVYRVSRTSGAAETLLGWSQFMWFAVADGPQVYIGTVTSSRFGGERAALLASSDQGNTWQKVLETALSHGPYAQGWYAESREASAGGWLYCTGGDESGPKSYRVRRLPPAGD